MLLSIFLADILPIFLVASVGFVLARYFDVSVLTLSRVTFNALVPCLVFNLLVTSPVAGLEFGRMALFALVVTLLIGVIAWLVAKALSLDRPMLIGFLLAIMFSNGGNLGLPVALFAFGREAATHASIYFVSSALLTYTVGVFLAASGRRTVRHALLGILRVPALYGVLSALAVLGAGINVPVSLMRPIALLSDAALPMMMLVLGMQLERTRAPERPGVVLAAAALSLLVTPLVALGVAGPIGLTGAAWQAAIIQASMPAAVITTILALEFDVAPGFVTSVVFVSTLLSPFTLTLLIDYLQRSV